MRVAITGGGGFVGAHLARALAARGDAVTVLDVRPDSPLLDGLDDIDRVSCDIADVDSLDGALAEARPERIFHTAGVLSADAEDRWRRAYEVNVAGTFNVFEGAVRHDVERVVFTSTVATYGPGIGDEAGDDTPQRPTTMYGVSKVFGERLGEWFDRTQAVDVRAVRLPALMGYGRGPGGASAYGSLVVSDAATTGRAIVPVTAETVMALAYIKDVVAGLIALADAPPSSLRQRTYSLDGFSPTAAELAAAVGRALPDAEVTIEPDEAMTAIVGSWPRRLDGSAARADWGWAPAFDLAGAVEDFVADLRLRPLPS